MGYERWLRWEAFLLLPIAVFVACTKARSDPAPARSAAPPRCEEASPPTPAGADSYERIDINRDLYVRKVQEGVFVITHSFPWPGNSMIVEMKSSDLVLVDTPYTPDATRDALEWIESRLGKRDVFAINTGFHHDNLGGNSYLIERSIPIYGSELTARLLEERGEDMRAMTLDWLKAPRYQRYYDAHRRLPYVAPTHLFELEEGLRLEFGDEMVQVYYPGPSHSPDNVVVYFPSRKVLFGGCMIIGMDSVGNTADADVAAWPGSLLDLGQFDFSIVVPGHGDRLDPGLIDHTVELLVDFQR